MHFQHTQLANGLDIIAETNPRAHSMALGFFVKTGARDETDSVSGVSHFLEHMAFKGSERFSAEDVNRVFDDVGANYNASTSEEVTLYFAAILPEYLNTSFELLSSLLEPSLRESDFDTEKQVILEEIAMYDDLPAFTVYEKAMQQHFRGHPLGRSILGSTDSIRALTATQMREYFSQAYVAGNITLVVAGNCDFDRIVRQAEACCGHWPAGRMQRDTKIARPQPSVSSIHKPTGMQQHLMSLAAGPASTDPLRYAAGLLAVAIGDDDNSRLYWELIDRGDADAAELGHNDFDGTGAWTTYLCCQPDDLEPNLNAVADIYREVNREGISDSELTLAKNKVATRIVLSGERPMGRLSSLGGNWVYAREYRSIEDELAAVQAVTSADIRRLLDEFPLTLTSTVGIGPLSELPEVPTT
jgi:predicted Zn-dependent peptidase